MEGELGVATAAITSGVRRSTKSGGKRCLLAPMAGESKGKEGELKERSTNCVEGSNGCCGAASTGGTSFAICCLCASASSNSI